MASTRKARWLKRHGFTNGLWRLEERSRLARERVADKHGKFRCKCGACFDKRIWLVEHIGICNPHWPRSSPDDEHGEITEVAMRQRKYNMKEVMALARDMAREMIQQSILEQLDTPPAGISRKFIEDCVDKLLKKNQNIVLMAKREWLEQRKGNK